MRAIEAHPGLRLVGLMAYEGQIAGVGDNAPGSPVRRTAIRTMQRASAAELRERRAEVVAAVRSLVPLEFVNGGGTGSLEATGAEDAVTELGAGSGLYSPGLFDTYRGFRHDPAASSCCRWSASPPPRARRSSAAAGSPRGEREGPAADPRVARRPAPQPDRGSRRGADPAARTGRRPPEGRRPGLVPARQGRRAVRAGERAAPRPRRRGRRRVPTYRGEGRAFL